MKTSTLTLSIVLLRCLFLDVQMLSSQNARPWTDERWPISNSKSDAADVVTSAFGGRTLQEDGELRYDFHRGIDIRAHFQDVHAVYGGKVVKTRNKDSNDNSKAKWVMLEHMFYDQDFNPFQVWTWYVHLNEIYVSVDDDVDAGDVIAQSGDSGTTSSHLHFGMLFNQRAIDAAFPEDYAWHPLWILPYDTFNEPNVTFEFPTANFTAVIHTKEHKDAMDIVYTEISQGFRADPNSPRMIFDLIDWAQLGLPTIDQDIVFYETDGSGNIDLSRDSGDPNMFVTPAKFSPDPGDNRYYPRRLVGWWYNWNTLLFPHYYDYYYEDVLGFDKIISDSPTGVGDRVEIEGSSDVVEGTQYTFQATYYDISPFGDDPSGLASWELKAYRDNGLEAIMLAAGQTEWSQGPQDYQFQTSWLVIVPQLVENELWLRQGQKVIGAVLIHVNDVNGGFNTQQFPILIEMVDIGPPRITSFNPMTGTVGISVIVTGASFTDATEVAFNGTSANFTIASDTQIATEVPVGATTGAITVSSGEGTGASLSPFTVAADAPPAITTFVPAEGPAGALVTIIGENFIDVQEVAFDGAPAQFTVTGADQVQAVVPELATTAPVGVQVSVKTPAGLATGPFEFIFAPGDSPFLLSFEPEHGGVGSDVTLTGSSFVDVQEVTCNGASATHVVKSDSTICARIPEGATTGKLEVTTAAGTATSSSDFVVESGSGATVHLEAWEMTLSNYGVHSGAVYSGGETTIRLISYTGTATIT